MHAGRDGPAAATSAVADWDAVGGNVDRASQHCRFCRFLSLVPSASSAPMPNSSRFAAFVNLTFRVMGGKNGNIRQDVATKWHGGRQKRQGSVEKRPRPRCRSYGCKRVRLARLPRYAVVQGAGGAG
jgi:hypothetical protein